MSNFGIGKDENVGNLVQCECDGSMNCMAKQYMYP